MNFKVINHSLRSFSTVSSNHVLLIEVKKSKLSIYNLNTTEIIIQVSQVACVLVSTLSFNLQQGNNFTKTKSKTDTKKTCQTTIC